MATRKAEVAVTCNIRQPKQAQKILIAALESLRKEYDRLVAAGDQNKAKAAEVKKNMDALSSAVQTNEQNMKRVQSVMDHLTGSTLKQLNAALREVKRQMSGRSGDSADLKKLQSQYSAITEQIKKLKGETIDITQGMRTLSNQTDAWLTKAIAKQKELMAQTRRNTLEYQAQKSVLRNLMAEQTRRTQNAVLTRGKAAMALASNPSKASMADLRTARQDLTAYRDSIGMGKGNISLGSAKQNAEAIKQINEMLKLVDRQIDSINGKGQKVTATSQQLLQSVRQVLQNLNQASPSQLKAKLDEVNQALANMSVNDPMRSRLVSSARELQQALDGVDKKAVNVRTILAHLDKASPKQLKAALDQVNRSLESLSRTSANVKRREDLVAQAKQLRQALAAVDKEAIDIDKVIKNIRKEPIENLRRAAAQLEKEMAKLDRGSNRAAYLEKRKQLAQIRQEVERTNRAVSAQAGSWRKTFQAISAYMGVTMIIGRVISMITSVIKLNLKLSDQLANIRKVSGMTMKSVLDLSDRLASIDTRTTIQELNEIAYAGAKLGMGKYGVNGLMEFTRAANQVNVALKEDMGQDALTALSKITEVMGLIPKMGVEKSMLATGSALFQLSATSTATSSNIVEFSKRLTGMARTAGITTDQLLGLGSAADSMFLMPEVASTAFNKFIAALQTKHNLIEKELSIEPGTISRLFEAGKIVDAMILVFEKMKEKGNMNALGSVFKDLGSEGARLVNVMVTMSQNVDMLRGHLETSKDAFEQATAVTNEYNIQQETAQALMERASNAWQKAFINRDGVDAVQALAQKWYDMSRSLTESAVYMAPIKAALWSIITSVKLLVKLLPALIMYMSFRGVHGIVMGVVSAYRAFAVAVEGATIKQFALNVVMKANVFLALASAIIYGLTWLYEYIHAADRAAESQRKLNSYVSEADTLAARESQSLRSYLSVLDDANTSAEQRARILRRFNKEYKPYIDRLGVEIKSVQDLKDNYAALNGEIRKKMYYQMREKAYNELLDQDGPDGQPSFSKALTNARMDYADFINNPENAWAKARDAGWLDSMLDAGFSPVEIAQMAAKDYEAKGWVKGADGEQKLSVSDSRTGVSQLIDLVGFKRMVERVKSARDAWTGEYQRITAAFPNLDNYDPSDPFSPLGSLDNEAPDKDAQRAARADRNRQKQQWRKELEDEQHKVLAVMDNIRNFYQRQITQVLAEANEQGWDEALIQSATEAIVARQNIAMSQARKAIAGVKNEWDEFKLTIIDDLKEADEIIGYGESGNPSVYNESRLLFDLIKQADITALRQRISGLEINLEKPEGSALYEIWRGATANEKTNETAEQRRIRERQKLLLEDNYTAKVDSDYSSSMTRLGFFDVDESQAQTLAAGGDKAKALLERRTREIESVFRAARERIVDLIAIDDVTTDDGRNRLLELIFGPNWDMDESELKEVFLIYGEDLKQFYDELIKYDNDYIEAQKKAEDRARKLADFQWEHSAQKQGLDSRERGADLYQRGLLQHANPGEAEALPSFGVYGNTRFTSDFGVDPEVEAYRLKMEAAQAYYDFLRAHGMEQEQLHEQQMAVAEAQAAYVEKLASRIKKQMDEVLGMHEPIENFGTKAGEAFALMTEDAEAGSKALRAAVGDMINDFMKQTVEMTKEYVKRRIMQKSHDRLTSLEASSHEAELTQIQSLGDSSRLGLHETAQTELTSIDQAQSIVRQTTAQTETAAEVGTEAAGTGAKVSLGIAAGAAKTIGALGWWGIPLVAVITMLLNGLLSFAMSKVSSLFGGKTASDSGTQAKLVSGMLTYDSGNVQAFRGVEDGKTYPVVGSDGEVYAAKDGGELSTGLVEDPITTLVNGQPALVAERGPEMVIGRETTAAMMMARPDILAEIVRFDRQRSGRTYRAYDSGNIDELQLPMPSGSNAEDMAGLRETIDTLATVLAAIQKNGILAHINQYGRGGVAQSARSGGKFMQRNSGDPLWRN